MENTANSSNENKSRDIRLRQDARKNYNERIKKSWGMATGIPKIDNLIGGMDEGTVSVIAGFTSHFKTMFAINIAHLNAYYHRYNIAYISLETPKEMMYDQLLSRHSSEPKFTYHHNFIPHDKIRRCELTQDEYNHLFDIVEPDLYAEYVNDKKELRKPGHLTFLDTADFETFDFAEINKVLEYLDDKMGGLDAVIVDYIQLCKFMVDNSYIGDDNGIINRYVAFFRKLAQGFRSGKKLIVILLSQINRDSWKRASKNKGVYDLTCLADANELERGASRVITTYTTENMKIANEAQVQLLKNRNGQTMSEPYIVYVKPETYFYGEEDYSPGQMDSSNMDIIFDDIFNSNNKVPLDLNLDEFE